MQEWLCSALSHDLCLCLFLRSSLAEERKQDNRGKNPEEIYRGS